MAEDVATINRMLKEVFGLDTITGIAIWRVVWSEDQLEKRLMSHTDAGIELLTPEVRLVPKYRQWIKEKWVLERLVIVPEISQKELADAQISYEPLWVFQDKDDKPVPPTWTACKFIVDTVYAAMGKSSLAKYVDDEKDNPQEKREQRIKELENELFGDESGLLGMTVTGQGIVVPQGYEKTTQPEEKK